MRKRWIQVDGKLIPADEYEAPPSAGFFIMGDTKPYKSMITGEMIEGRAKHRAHLKEHNCVEVGNAFDNAKPKPLAPPPGLKERLIQVANSKL